MLLKVNQLSVSTNTTRPFTILKDVSFSLEHNTILSITGRNGSGKTTLIKALTSLMEIKEYTVTGEVYINDQPLTQLSIEQLVEIRKHKIKYVFQDAVNSFNPLLKIGYYFENFPGDHSSEDDLLEYFYLPPRKKLFKLHPYELSGGMAQRTAIVLALRAKPELLIFDEPTSAIDSPAINLLVHKLKEFCREEKKSVLVVTQDLDFANEVSSCISWLNNGSLTELLSPAAFDAAYGKNFPGRLLNNTGPEQ